MGTKTMSISNSVGVAWDAVWKVLEHHGFKPLHEWGLSLSWRETRFGPDFCFSVPINGNSQKRLEFDLSVRSKNGRWAPHWVYVYTEEDKSSSVPVPSCGIDLSNGKVDIFGGKFPFTPT